MERVRLVVSGRVQGVGFRPTVYRHAVEAGLTGFVRNSTAGVEVEVQGIGPMIEVFLARLKTRCPRQARMDTLHAEHLPVRPDEQGFQIMPSERSGDLVVGFPPDLAACGDCVREVLDPSDRRHGYPFTNCTNCGPRFTIVSSLPYDRARTSMAAFSLCERCHKEYTDPSDRRFDAQPNACPACGPRLSILGADGQVLPVESPLLEAVRLLKEGRIGAVKGLGGYHLCCLARSDEAVRRLRERKGRRDKPFAVMFADADEVTRYCEATPAEVLEMLDVAAPVVVVARHAGTELSSFVAPDTRDVGAFLPYTPLHHLLLKKVSPLVMTSGNVSEEPITHAEAELSRILGKIADFALVHNRPILRRCDDSVVRLVRGEKMVLRRSRGWVPAPISLSRGGPPVLAMGAELKNTFCLTRGAQAFLSQHIGDLTEHPSLAFYEEAISDLCALLGVEPGVIAHDLHPAYESTRLAAARPADRRIAVQHHHAHIAACMAEHRLEGPVIGVAMDGSGLGDDGTIWGGEFLVADYRQYQRRGYLQTLRLPGGEGAIRHPVRMALGMLHAEFGAEADRIGSRWLPALQDADRQVLLRMLESGTQAPVCSSAGRWFDAVSALLGLCDTISYEGQAAVRLQAQAAAGTSREYAFALDMQDDRVLLSFRPMIRKMIEDLHASVPSADIARGFHETMAAGIAAVCARLAESGPTDKVVLSGGVFQNELLLLLVTDALGRAGLKVYSHREVPPNDGGIALGQAAVALATMEAG